MRYADLVPSDKIEDSKRRNWQRILTRALRIGFEPVPANILPMAVFFTSLVALVAMTVLLADGEIYAWEVDVTREFQKTGYPEWAFDLTANRLTNSDTPIGAAIIFTVVAGLWLLRLRIESVLLLLLSVPLHVAANFPKLLVERERPGDVLDGTDGFGGVKSFPSGHAEFAITFYGFLLYIAMTHVRSRALKAALATSGVAMALTVGFARIEVGKHWPLDVLAGYTIGIGILALLIWALRTLYAASRAVD